MDEDVKRRPVSDIIGRFEKTQFSTEAKKRRPQINPKPPFVQPGLRNVTSSQTIQHKQDSVSAVDHSYTSSQVQLRHSTNVETVSRTVIKMLRCDIPSRCNFIFY